MKICNVKHERTKKDVLPAAVSNLKRKLELETTMYSNTFEIVDRCVIQLRSTRMHCSKECTINVARKLYYVENLPLKCFKMNFSQEVQHDFF